MGQTAHTVTLYTLQWEIVASTLARDGICFSKKNYIKKSMESAAVFLWK